MLSLPNPEGRVSRNNAIMSQLDDIKGVCATAESVLDDKELDRELRKQLLASKFNKQLDLGDNLRQLETKDLKQLLYDHSLLIDLGLAIDDTVKEHILVTLMDKEYEVSNEDYRNFVIKALVASSFVVVTIVGSFYLIRHTMHFDRGSETLKLLSLLLM